MTAIPVLDAPQHPRRSEPCRSTTFRSLTVGALVACAGTVPVRAQDAASPTRVQVRVVARDAKLLGDAVGGARVTITDVATGDTLAQGLTAGGTGDTQRIMRAPRERGVAVFDTPGAAGWVATFALRRPTLVEIAAEGPLEYPEATVRATRRMLLAPGAEIVGDGIVLELHGYIVEILEAGISADDGTLPIRARVRMLCSCPTEPGGLWQAGDVSARLVAGERVASEAPLAYTGTTSEYEGRLSAPAAAGSYTVEVLAANSTTGNFGIARRRVEIK